MRPCIQNKKQRTKQNHQEGRRETRRKGERKEERRWGERKRGKGESGVIIPGPSIVFLARLLSPFRAATQVLGGVYHPGFSWAALLEEVKVSVLPPTPQLRALWPQATPSCASAGHNVPSSVLSCLLLTLDTQVVYKTQTQVN